MSKSGYAFWQLKRFRSEGGSGAKHLSHVLREKTERKDIGDTVFFEFFDNIKQKIEKDNIYDPIGVKNIQNVDNFFKEKEDRFLEMIFDNDLEEQKTVGFLGGNLNKFYHQISDIYGYHNKGNGSHFIDIMFSFPSSNFANHLREKIPNEEYSDEEYELYKKFEMEDNFSALPLKFKEMCMPMISEWFYKVTEEMLLKNLFISQSIFEQYSFCCLHLDEAQPHVHYIMPSVCTNGKRFQLNTVPSAVNIAYKNFLEHYGWMPKKDIDNSQTRRSIGVKEYRLAENTFKFKKPEITKSLDFETQIRNQIMPKLQEIIISDFLNDNEEVQKDDELREILNGLIDVKPKVQWNMMSLLKHRYPDVFKGLLLGDSENSAEHISEFNKNRDQDNLE